MASRFEYIVEVAAARGSGQDRARVFERDNGCVIALADGAGGTGNGSTAAQAIIDAVGTVGAGVNWAAFLADLDGDPRLAGGQSTAVVLALSDAGIVGASVGDSGAWLIAASVVVDLTDGQDRKPLVGDGCNPFRITASAVGRGTLLVASDGLLRYAKQSDIARIANETDMAMAAHALVDLVRLPSGGLQDDVCIVLCRQRQ